MPRKRPLSSMSPTIVTKDGKIFTVLGSPGGSRIISITLQTALNIIDHGMAPQEAVNAPRIHHQWLPDEVYYEQRGVSKDSLNLLDKMGYKMVEQTPWGAAELIMVGLRVPPESVRTLPAMMPPCPVRCGKAIYTVPTMCAVRPGRQQESSNLPPDL